MCMHMWVGARECLTKRIYVTGCPYVCVCVYVHVFVYEYVYA